MLKIERKFKLFFVLFLLALVGYTQQNKVTVTGELKKWHKVTLNLEGDFLVEKDTVNPFLNYRLNVIFKSKNKVYIVPGFYAADGNAAETSATKGNVWRAHFMPDEEGEWSYEVLFKKGENIALSSDIHAGKSVGFHGVKGHFTITSGAKVKTDFRAKGRLQYANKRYLQYTETKEPFIKGAAVTPKNFLAYYEFNNTLASRKYALHAPDWKNTDPVWQNNKGKNMIGFLNYLASKEMNSIYFEMLNLVQRNTEVYPWVNVNNPYRLDCSKLDQWEIVFDHMDKLGIMLDIELHVTHLKAKQKLYYRELIARFSHHLGMTWNIVQEDELNDGYTAGLDVATYVKETDPYKSAIVLHSTKKLNDDTDIYLTPALGHRNVDGVALQVKNATDVNSLTSGWIKSGGNYNKPWVVKASYKTEVSTNKIADGYNIARAKVLWGHLMSGGAGIDWCSGGNNLDLENLRTQEAIINQTKQALNFFNKHIPLKDMVANNTLTDNPKDYVLTQKNKVYAIYLPEYKKTKLNLRGNTGTFSVSWYNPKQGGPLQVGRVKILKGGKFISIGKPPTVKGDWVALIKNIDSKIDEAIPSTINNTIVLQALKDFKVDTTSAAVYYKERKRGTLAIRANKKNQRNKLALAKTKFQGETGYYHAVLHTLAENDGESTYKIYTNKSELKTVKNPAVADGFKDTKLSLGVVFFKKNGILKIGSKAATNGKIPEHEGTAWSRGRWRSLTLTPVNLNFKKQLKTAMPFKEVNGKVQIEAEFYHYNTNNKSPRAFYKVNKDINAPFFSFKNYTKNASANGYIIALPDTRVTHKDELIRGENFFQVPGTGGMVSYKVKINNPGRYYVWVKALSTGAEDNGLHVGINGTWPKSGQRIQLCKGKRKWTWSSAQRVPKNHCGTPNTIYLDVKAAGEHIVSFSMREDGFKLDQFILVKDENFTPL